MVSTPAPSLLPQFAGPSKRVDLASLIESATNPQMRLYPYAVRSRRRRCRLVTTQPMLLLIVGQLEDCSTLTMLILEHTMLLPSNTIAMYNKQ